MKSFCPSLVVVASLVFAGSSFGAANPNTNNKTKRLYDWIKSFGGSSNRVLCGQQAAPNSISWLGNFNSVYWGLGSVTGQYPAMVGGDLGEHSTSETNDLAGTLDWMADNEGNVITLSWHADNPFTGGDMRDRRDVDLPSILPGGSERGAWLALLDETANWLQYLEDQGHPVLWRPLHEMNGDWFWWGKRNQNNFKELWRDMFNYFTYTKGLNNLLWVYSPNNKTGNGISNYDAFYPGSSYVDIVAADVYSDDAFIQDTGRLTNKGKPIFYGEFGPARSDGNFGYWELVYRIQNNHSWIKGWLSWNDWRNGNGTWSYKSIAGNRHEWLQYNDWVINRDEVNY